MPVFTSCWKVIRIETTCPPPTLIFFIFFLDLMRRGGVYVELSGAYCSTRAVGNGASCLERQLPVTGERRWKTISEEDNAFGVSLAKGNVPP